MTRFAPRPHIEFRDSFTRGNPEGARGVVVLFHGLTGTPAEMEPLADELARRGYCVSVPRLSGHAATLPELGRVTAQVWIADARSTLAQCFALSPIVHVAGLSFGALLALLCAEEGHLWGPDWKVCSLGMFSPPLFLRRKVDFKLLQALALLPDFLVDRLGTIPKSQRPEGYLAMEHIAHPRHSIAAATRMMQIRRKVVRALPSVRCPIMLACDPFDHLVDGEAGCALLKRHLPKIVTLELPNGQHELTLGPKHALLEHSYVEFLERLNRSN